MIPSPPLAGHLSHRERQAFMRASLVNILPGTLTSRSRRCRVFCVEASLPLARKQQSAKRRYALPAVKQPVSKTSCAFFNIFLKKLLTKPLFSVIMVGHDCYGHLLCVAAALWLSSISYFIYRRCIQYEAYLPAQPSSSFQGSRFPPENGNFQRP